MSRIDNITVGNKLIEKMGMIPETPYYIVPPRKQTFRGLSIVWLLLFIAVILSYKYFFFIAFPVLLITGYLSFEYTKVWKSCGYKSGMYWLLTACVLCLFIAASGWIRGIIFSVLCQFMSLR